MDMLKGKKTQADPLDLQFMSPVDVALHQRGHPYAFLLSLAVLLFFVIFFLWASVAKIDEVTRGQGQVIPAEGINPVQSDRGGTIYRILARENEKVTEGQVLVMLSNDEEMATLRDLQNKNIELTLSILRLEAEARDEEPFFPPELEQRYPEAVRAQRQVFGTRKQQFAGEDLQLEAQLEQRQREAEEARQRKAQYENSLALLEQQEKTVRPMVGRSYSQIDYMDLQRQIIDQRGELATIAQTISRAESGILAAEERMNARHAERQAHIAEELNKNRIEQASIQEQMRVSDEQVLNTELRAPIDGTIKTIPLKEGAVAKPAETIMELIPLDGMLEIEGKFRPEDRGFLYVSQPAMIKFNGYDFSIYGGLEAHITRISEDTIEDKKGEPWYEVRFVTREKSLYYQGQALEIHPGMTVMVDVLTDKRTVLDMILRPILQAKDNAMTER
jgi:type I secretion membrane fusion protein, HlyD family